MGLPSRRQRRRRPFIGETVAKSIIAESESEGLAAPRGAAVAPGARRRRRAWRPRPAPPALWAVCRGATLGMRFRRRRRGEGGRARRAAGTETADSAARGSRLQQTPLPGRGAGLYRMHVQRAPCLALLLAFASQPAQVAATQVSRVHNNTLLRVSFASITRCISRRITSCHRPTDSLTAH